MEPGRWRRTEALFHAALARPPEARRGFLVEACADDTDLRRQVEQLVAEDERAGSLLERPAVDETAAPTACGSWLGRQCGSYRITGLLGVGGMSEVYRAHDDKLGRDVAIKTLPPEFASDPARVARFRREARILASLNHPNIAAIHGLEELPDADFLVLELVEGDTPRGPLPLATALEYAGQVADALEAAHDHGVVHRDLKPANLKVTPLGTVKVLDFGLAKVIWGAAATPDLGEPVAVTGDATAAGHLLGTPAYMSPEQAQGTEVDQRTDIWAFGCLLYEFLTGKRAFESGSVPTATAAVLECDPDWQALPAMVPRKIRDLLHQCLQKNANRRLNHIRNARAVIEDVRHRPRRTPRGAAAAQGSARRSSVGRIRTLAVLPLASLAGDPEQDWFADGMTEALTVELAQIRALRVISRTSVMRYKATRKPIPEIARELGADGIVEGSVMRAGERVRITAQLIQAATNRHLWAHVYERDMRDVLQLQGEVARAIADEIHVTLTPQERARLARSRPVNVEAHEAYVRGRYDWARANLRRSIEHFERAIAVDPDYALAYAGIADAECKMFGAALELVPPAQVAPLARAAAVRALELDETLAEPHVSLSRVLFWHDRDPVGAERELRRAVQLNPNCAMAHFISGLLYADLGRSNEAMAAFHLALQIDPVSAWNSTISGFFMCELGQVEAGRQQLLKAIELDPSFFLPWSLSSVIDCYEGRFPEATAKADEGVRLSAGVPMALAYAGYALARAGRRAETIAILDQLEVQSGQRYVPAIARVWCHLGLGDHERAIDWLETGDKQRDSHLPHVRLMQAFGPLLPAPRYQDLLRRLGLPP
jgi:eukaryotic-like serine/threonine-protein kinase